MLHVQGVQACVPCADRASVPPVSIVSEYVFIVFTFHLVLVCFLFSFFSHVHEDITNLTEITCARRVAAGPGRVRVKIVISVTVTDSVYTGPSRLALVRPRIKRFTRLLSNDKGWCT